jgi:hypothetical protein
MIVTCYYAIWAPSLPLEGTGEAALAMLCYFYVRRPGSALIYLQWLLLYKKIKTQDVDKYGVAQQSQWDSRNPGDSLVYSAHKVGRDTMV